jgi:hypothetical protein
MMVPAGGVQQERSMTMVNIIMISSAKKRRHGWHNDVYNNYEDVDIDAFLGKDRWYSLWGFGIWILALMVAVFAIVMSMFLIKSGLNVLYPEAEHTVKTFFAYFGL